MNRMAIIVATFAAGILLQKVGVEKPVAIGLAIAFLLALFGKEWWKELKEDFVKPDERTRAKQERTRAKQEFDATMARCREWEESVRREKAGASDAKKPGA